MFDINDLSKKYSALFTKQLRIFFDLLVMLSIFRLVLFVANRTIFLESNIWEIFLAFFQGIRFDILVLGFIAMPLVFWNILHALQAPYIGNAKIFRTYLYLTWILICILNAVNFIFFNTNLQHFSLKHYSEWPFHMLLVESMDKSTLVLGLSCFAICLLKAIKIISKYSYNQNIQIVENKKICQTLGFIQNDNRKFFMLLRVLWPTILVALCARGTLRAHHLEKVDSEISANQALNELVLNPMWTLDK